MTPKLYASPAGAPTRAVLILAKALNLELNSESVDLRKGEHLTLEYLQMNPVHTVPALKEDDGFVLWESHAILPYLADKYGKNDDLYPKDLRKRALVDQKLHFNNGTILPHFKNIVVNSLFKGLAPPEEDRERLREIYGFLEKFLENSKWFAGDLLTIADICLVSTLSALNFLEPFETAYPKLTAWFASIQKEPAYEANKPGLESFKAFVAATLKTKE